MRPRNSERVVTWLDYLTLSDKELAKKIKQSKKINKKTCKRGYPFVIICT